MFKKFCAFLLIGTMILSLAACGKDDDTKAKPTATTAPSATPTATPTPEPPKQNTIDHSSDLPADASSYLNFEDGKFTFAAVAYSNPACNLASELSVVDFAGSKALKVSSPVSDNVFSGTIPYLAIDVVSLLGDKAANVAKIQFDIGQDHGTEKFAAISGQFAMYTGAADALAETKAAWSVYLETQNPKVFSVDVPAGGFSDPSNYIMIYIDSDAAANGHANIYLDNVVFYDAEGNAIVPDAAAAFALEGMTDSFWMNLDWSNGVKQPANETIVAGAGEAFGGGWWPSTLNALTFTPEGEGSGYVPVSTDVFKPGTVLTIYYDGEGDSHWQFPYIRVQSWADDATETTEAWAGTAFDYQFELTKDEAGEIILEGTQDQRNESWTIVQYTYDELNTIFTEKLGENWATKLDFMGIADMGFTGTIYKVTIGDIQ